MVNARYPQPLSGAALLQAAFNVKYMMEEIMNKNIKEELKKLEEELISINAEVDAAEQDFFWFGGFYNKSYYENLERIRRNIIEKIAEIKNK